MLAMLRDLFQHQAYADAALLKAIRRHEIAAQDLELRTLAHHIFVAHRYWIHLSQGLPFGIEDASKAPDSLELIVTRYRDMQAQEKEWLTQLCESDLVRTVETPFLPGQRFTLREALVQVCMHSHGHRVQCAARLRALGGEPPPLDFVVWLKDRTAPDWYT